MAYTLFQGGSSLQIMDTSGTLTTLTLPTGITLNSTARPRFAVFGRYVVVVNSPSRPITVDPEGTVRVLTPRGPRTKPTLSTGTGSLTGTYKVRQTYIVWDSDGTIISESGMGVESLSGAVAGQALAVAGLDLATDTVSATRLYRNSTNGSVYFPWIDVDGNTTTSIEDDLADASLELASAPLLGDPPHFSHIGEYRERLFGVGNTDIDAIRYSEAGMMYAWPEINRIIIPREGADDRGITGILARRDALAVARQNALVEIKGDRTANFSVVRLSGEIGVEADDSIAQFRDVIYFLAKDGVYTWSNSGIQSISDGKVRSWFTTDTYFNRGRLRYAVGRIDPLTSRYQLLLSAAGSSDLDRWIEYDIKDQTWWGPHKTTDFTPSWMTTILDANSLPMVVIGSSTGFFYKEQDTRTDGTATGIALDVEGKFHDMNSPDIMKYFGQLSLLSKIQASGTLSVIPYVGELSASAGTTISASMTAGREKLRRLGTGRFCKLVFQNSTAGVDCEIYGFDLPFHELGRR